MRMYFVRTVMAITAVTAAAVTFEPVAAQERYVVPRLEGVIRLDGYSDEPAWARIPPLPATMSFPTYGAEPSERTEFRLAYDDDHLYAAARMYDRDPSGIRAVSLRRDESSFANDWFLLSLDTFRDRENTLLFATSPAGIRTDAAFANDATTGPNMAWNAHWDAAAARDEEGWYAEIRIPLSSLRFEERDGEVVMGVIVARRIARRNEMISWPGVPHEWGTFSIYKASQMAEIVLRDVRRRNPVYLMPYALGGVGRINQVDASTGAYVGTAVVRREPGLDVKYSPTSNITFDLTVNPDFAQVEADDEQVNLTRFSIFFPERRPFFQERASTFAFPLVGSSRLFHSRRIGLVNGTPARIHAGARVVGRAAGWDFGMLQMQTEATGVSPVENAGVLSARRQVFNANSNIGAMITTRFGRDGSRNVATGADALLRIRGQDYLTISVAETFAGAAADTGHGSRSFARIAWERRGLYGFNWEMEASRVGESFEPALGFVSRTGIEYGAIRAAHGWRAEPASRLLRQSASVAGAVYRGTGGRIESAEAGPAWRLETKSGHAFTIAALGRHENLARAFRVGPDAVVPPGTYRFAELAVAYDPLRTPNMRVTASARGGGFYDGRRISLTLTPAWNPSARLQLSTTLQGNRIRFDDRDEQFDALVARVRALVMFDARTSAYGFVQYSSAGDVVIGNLRLRYNRREGNDLHVVYNHVLNTDRFSAEPFRPLTDSRTFIVKYSYTLPFGL